MTRARRALFITLLLVASACGGGGSDDGSDADDSSSASGSEVDADETTTTEPEDDAAEVEVPTSFTATGTYDRDVELSAIVAGPDRYSLRADILGEDLRGETRRFDDRLFDRQAADCRTMEAEGLFITGTVEELTALGSLLDAAAFGELPDPEDDFSGADLVSSAIGEYAFTDPVGLLGDQVLVDEDLEVELPEELAEVLDEGGFELPAIEARAEGDDGVLDELHLRIVDEVAYEVDVRYELQGEVVDDDVQPPTAEQIDQTPDLDEAGLLAYQETPLLLAPAPPDGMVLAGALVLPAAQTLEGCVQAEIDYASPDGLGDFVLYFLIPQACSLDHDDTPFDETTGGLPSRFDGFEILVGETVVQISASDPDFDVGAFVASLVPITAEELIARVLASG